jgi:hypothetical protein
LRSLVNVDVDFENIRTLKCFKSKVVVTKINVLDDCVIKQLGIVLNYLVYFF